MYPSVSPLIYRIPHLCSALSVFTTIADSMIMQVIRKFMCIFYNITHTLLSFSPIKTIFFIVILVILFTHVVVVVVARAIRSICLPPLPIYRLNNLRVYRKHDGDEIIYDIPLLRERY